MTDELLQKRIERLLDRLAADHPGHFETLGSDYPWGTDREDTIRALVDVGAPINDSILGVSSSVSLEDLDYGPYGDNSTGYCSHWWHGRPEHTGIEVEPICSIKYDALVPEHLYPLRPMLFENIGERPKDFLFRPNACLSYYRFPDSDSGFCTISFIRLFDKDLQFNASALRELILQIMPGKLSMPLRMVGFSTCALRSFDQIDFGRIGCWIPKEDYQALMGVEELVISHNNAHSDGSRIHEWMGVEGIPEQGTFLRRMTGLKKMYFRLKNPYYFPDWKTDALPPNLEVMEFDGARIDVSSWYSISSYYRMKSHGLRFENWSDRSDPMRERGKNQYLKFAAMESAGGDEEVAFRTYSRLMKLLGYTLGGAGSFYGLQRNLGGSSWVTETLNTEASLNLTVFLRSRFEDPMFVKFYSSASMCAKDVQIQNFLAERDLALPCRYVSLKRDGIESLIDNLSDEDSSRGLADQHTMVDDKLTVAFGRQGQKLGYALTTEVIGGANFEKFMKAARDVPETMLANMKRLVDMVMRMHDAGNDPAVRDDIIPKYAGGSASAACGVLYGRTSEQQSAARHLWARRLASNAGVSSGDIASALDAVRVLDRRIYSYMREKQYVSFTHGDLHMRNIMVDMGGLEEKGEYGDLIAPPIDQCTLRFIDFERSSISLKVEDLVRMYDFVSVHDDLFPVVRPYEELADEVKDYYFRKSFGDGYDRDACEEMFALMAANYYLVNTVYYLGRISEAKGVYEREEWQKKYEKARIMVGDSLYPHMARRHVDAITNYLESARGKDD